ncbi:hypothetical protein CFOL_v3_19652, partial [Cephalotus follicularis]
YRARRKARIRVEGNFGEAYSKLHKYAKLVRITNPGTLVFFEHQTMHEEYQGPPTFKRVFISYEASIRDFSVGCRPFIGLVGYHLKGPYGGVLLVVVALDGDQGLFPVAFVIVEIES